MKAIPWFQAVDWDALYNKQIKMPYQPKLNSDTDLSSFETTFTREKPIDSVMENDGAENKKKSNKGGIMGFLGYGNGTDKNKTENGEADSFKGFSFTKEESEEAAIQNKTSNSTRNSEVSVTPSTSTSVNTSIASTASTATASVVPRSTSPVRSNLTTAIKASSNEKQ